jgi:hypothetical protein
MKPSCRVSTILKFLRYSGFVIFIMARINLLSYSQLPLKADLVNHEKYYSEELHIVTDRNLYAAGEKVWFKIFKLNSLTNIPASPDKVVYVNILNPENDPVVQLKIETDGFSGSGDFTLPDTLKTGNYILCSYTNWMQNFSKDLFSYKSISVINPFDKITNLRNPYTDQVADNIIFYPEGGHLLAGFETKLGFKVTDRNGNPVKLTGSLVNDRNDTLSRVKTGNNGYGIVSFRPSGLNTIFLVPSDKNQNKKFPLPDVQKEGVIISDVRKNKDSQAVAELNFSSNYDSNGNNIYLEVYSPGLSGLRKTLLTGQERELFISSNDIPFGISYLKVVDEHEYILTDRWIYKGNNNSLNYTIILQSKEHLQREKIRIDITANDAEGLPVESDFSISVVKSVTSGRNIIGLENCRQLPGMVPVIEDCNLKDVNDYLIFYKQPECVTNKNVNADYTPAYLPELEGHLISGNIREKISGEPLRNESLTLSFVGKRALCLFTRTDDKGNFNFVTKEKGLKEIVIQPLAYTKECYVDLNITTNPGSPDFDHGSLCPDTSKLDDINNLIISTQISKIYEPFYRNPIKMPEEKPKHDFYGQPDKSILMSKYIELTSVKEIISELIPGVTTTRNNGKLIFRMTKPYQTMPFMNGPMVLLDGVPVYDLEKVSDISSKDIERIDVLNDRYYVSGNVLDGILHIVTKKGDFSATDPDRFVFRMEYDLLNKEDPFFSPDYSLDSLKNNHLPDFRNTLYWNPDLHTARDGKTEIEFYSSDESAEYTIIIEGITADGKRGYSVMPIIINPR